MKNVFKDIFKRTDSVRHAGSDDVVDIENTETNNNENEMVILNENNRRLRDMKVDEVKSLIGDLRDNLGDACVASTIISYRMGSAIDSYKFDDKMAALIGKYTTFLQEMIVKSGFGKTCRYYTLNFPDNLMAFNLVFNDYCWATIVDVSKVPLGMIMNGILPDCIDSFQKVIG